MHACTYTHIYHVNLIRDVCTMNKYSADMKNVLFLLLSQMTSKSSVMILSQNHQ